MKKTNYRNYKLIIGLTILLSGSLSLYGCSDEPEITVSKGNIIVDNSIVTQSQAEIAPMEIIEEPLEEISEEPIQEEITLPSSENISFDSSWQYADFSKICSGEAVLYRAYENRKDIVVAVNAGHGTNGGQSVKTYCHPDMSPKVTGGTTSAGSITAVAVSGGMTFLDGTKESSVNLAVAVKLKETLLSKGYDVLMIRDGDDVQLDNVARTVIANNNANCHIALHFDGDNLQYDKGCFYISTPDGIKNMEPVAANWQNHESLGKALIQGLQNAGCKIYQGGSMKIDLTQTSFSTIPSVDIELGNAASAHDDSAITTLANGLASGIDSFFNQ